VAAAERARPQPCSQLSAGHDGRTQAPLTQANLPFLFRSMCTLRFLMVARVRRLSCLDGRNGLRFAHNPTSPELCEWTSHALAATMTERRIA
jgi:hypothetical protein